MTQKSASYTPEHFHQDVAAACGMSTSTPSPHYSVQIRCVGCGGSGRVDLVGDDDVACLRCQGKGLVEGGL